MNKMKMFFVYDPNDGIEFYETEERAKAEAEKYIESYRDEAQEGWADEVEGVCWGEVIQHTVQTSCTPAPEGSEFDEICDYGLQNL